MTEPTLQLSHLGQSGFRMNLGDLVAYIDPYLSDHVEALEGPTMRRLRPAPCTPATIDDADWLLISHIHADHCDPETIAPIANNNPDCRFLGSYEVIEFLVGQLGIDASRTELAREQWLQLSDHVRVLPIAAAHRQIDRNPLGQPRCVGFLIEAGGKRIYHSGDCSVHPEIVARLQALGPPDLALLPVNECNYYRDQAGIIGNMSIREAFGLAVEIGADAVVPMHYDMFAPNCVYTEEIQAVFQNLRPPFRLVMPEKLSSI